MKWNPVEYTFDAAENEMIHSPACQAEEQKSHSGPFEFFVDLYGLPAYDEVDPTALVAITYILLFGIMFGDRWPRIVCFYYRLP